MYWCVVFFLFFFFKQKTAYEMRISDWSSDVCSSDLGDILEVAAHIRVEPIQDVARLARRVGRHGDQIDAEDVFDHCGAQPFGEIGRASCRERVCQYV